jgi:hypothetical protein
MRGYSLSVLFILVAALIAGCSSRPAAGLYNNSGRRIIGTVQQGNTPIVHRSLLAPGEWKIDSPWPTGIGAMATVSWQEGEGQEFSRDVPLKDVVPAFFNGTVWFKVEPDRTVVVVPVSRGDANKGTAGPDAWRRESRQ